MSPVCSYPLPDLPWLATGAEAGSLLSGTYGKHVKNDLFEFCSVHSSRPPLLRYLSKNVPREDNICYMMNCDNLGHCDLQWPQNWLWKHMIMLTVVKQQPCLLPSPYTRTHARVHTHTHTLYIHHTLVFQPAAWPSILLVIRFVFVFYFDSNLVTCTDVVAVYCEIHRCICCVLWNTQM